MIGPMLKELSNARGSAQKIAILKRYDTPQMRTLLKYTYDKDYVYHIKPDIVSPINLYDRMYCLWPEEQVLLRDLHDKVVSGGAAHSRLEALKQNRLVKLVLGRDLQCGIAATTINKAMPGCIPQFKVQLAKEVPLDRLKFPVMAQLKYDGVRLVTLIDEAGTITFKTRNGKVVPLPRLRDEIAKSELTNVMLDGELVDKEGSMETRTKVSGQVNSAMHGGSINETTLKYMLFDTLPLDQFLGGRCALPCTERLRALYSTVRVGLYVKLAPTHDVHFAHTVTAKAEELYESGMEGLILKQPNHLYSFKRSPDWAKIKETKTVDLRCIEWEEGTGKYEGMIGSLKCAGVVEGKRVTVFVGSGLSDEDRDHDPIYYLSQFIEIKYNSVIQDSKTGEWSLFLPRYVTTRFDK